MLKLIIANDGAIGVDTDPACDPIWCHSQAEALEIVWGEVKHRNQFSKEEIKQEIGIAVHECTKHRHTIAHFGVLGSFLYSEAEKNQEF